MKSDEMVRSLSMPLPEEVQKRKWSGDLAGAVRMIDAMLEDDGMPELLRARLTVEKERIRRLPTQYPFDRQQAAAELGRLLPGLTDAEFDRYEDLGYIDFILVNGEKRYFIRFAPSMMTRADVRVRAGDPMKPEDAWLDPMMRTIREKGVLSRRITMEASLTLDPGSFVPGVYRTWMPYPAHTAQQSDIRLLAGETALIAPEDAPARTICREGWLDSWQDLTYRFSYVSTIRYADPLHAPAPSAPLYPDALPVCADDLAEDPPFIRFTPYLRRLAADLARGESTPQGIAWRCYEFVTTKVRYAFMRDYFQIDDIGEFCALNRKGDCGLQALLFIQLCRLNGIPARWQSGRSISADGVGSHDWAQFRLPGWGWLFADPSFGGSAYRAGAGERHAFYFGNLDPMRLAANRVFEASFIPQGEALRIDPYDNQSGEAERVGQELPFTGRQLDETFTVLSVEDL